MAFNLSSPIAKLAFEMALKNQQSIDSAGQFDAQARAAVSDSLKYGNETLPPFEDVYRSYVDPAEAQRRAQAEAFNAYLVGLPELLAQAAKEGRSSGSGTSALDRTNLSNYETPAQRLNRLLGSILPSKSTTATTTATKTFRPVTRFADAEERRVNNETLRARAL